MYFRLITNEIKKNKLINITTTLFIGVAALLVALGAILTVNLTRSIDTLMTESKTPHFFQMHAGKIDENRLERFVREQENVEDYQLVEFLNIEGSKFDFGSQTLANNVQDNGVSVQNPRFDYLLDLDNQIIDVKPGEIYVPISYIKEGLVKVNQKIKIANVPFTVKGPLRDGQMQSPLASSKRFLVHPSDYKKLVSQGSIEYLVEFRVKDLSEINALETAYAEAGLEMNGPSLTYPLLKVINGLSDGIMIAIILLIAFLIVAIAFMCVRFTLLTKISDDYREIGVMKAIGIPVKKIQRIYLAKYFALASIGCAAGYLASMILSPLLLNNIRSNWGESSGSHWSNLLAFFGCLLVFVLVLLYTRWLLRRFKKIPAAEALRNGSPSEKAKKKSFLTFDKFSVIPTNVFLGWKDVFTRKKVYLTMLLVLILSTFIMILPWNLYNTVSSPSFIKYLGIGKTDLVIGMYQTNDPLKKTEEITNYLEKNDRIKSYTPIVSKSYKVPMEDGTEEKLIVDVGDHEAFPVEYTAGTSPKREDEIALSSLNAKTFSKQVGDTLTVIVNGQPRNFRVSGIYSTIFNGGKTAKSTFEDDSAPITWVNYYANFKDHYSAAETASDAKTIAESLPFAKVSDAQEYQKQTFGSTIDLVKLAAMVSIVVSLGITILITLLFMRLLVTKDQQEIAILKAIGYRNSDISSQYASRAIMVLILGVLGGNILANTLGKLLVNRAVTSFGLDSMTLISQPLIYLGGPLLLLAGTLIATRLGTKNAGKISLAENLKE